MSDQHLLRPEFTAYLLEKLERGASVNLIGLEGQGSGRLLLDIASQCPDEICLVSINMKTCRESFPRFLQAISEQAGLSPGPKEFNSIISLLKARDGKVFLLLEHFDALLDNPRIDPSFNVAFFDYLNSLKNAPNISLLCQTDKPHDSALVYVRGKVHSNSWLDLVKEKLTEITYEQVELELERKLKDNPQWKRNPGTYLNQIMGHEAPYLFMQFVITETLQLEESAIDMNRQFKKWRTAFNKMYRDRHPGKGFRRFYLSLERFLILIGLGKLRRKNV